MIVNVVRKTIFIVSVARRPEVSRVRSIMELCGLRVSVESYVAPKGTYTMQTLPTLRTYAAKLRLCATVRRVWGLTPVRGSSLSAVAVGVTTQRTTVVV